MNSKDALMKAGLNLQMIRQDKNFSVSALSVLSQVDEQVIIGLEAGNFDVPVSVIFELAAALNVDFRKILVNPNEY